MAKLKAKHPKKAMPRKPRILIYGKAGVGKTWGTIEFPGVYYFDCEGGASLPHYTDKLAKAEAGYLGPEDGANDIQFVTDQVRALATQKHEYRTVVFDSYSKVYNTAIQVEYDRLQGLGRDMTKSFGAEKKPAIAATRQIVRWLERVEMNVIFVCHEKAEWKDGEQIGETFDAWDKLAFELDMTMQILKTGKARKAKVCKSRLEQFKEGELVDWSYATFAERFGSNLLEAEAVHLDACTPAQIQTVTELAEIIKLDDSQRLKWFEKAGVTCWSEMDSDTISKCIDFLRNLIPNGKAQIV